MAKITLEFDNRADLTRLLLDLGLVGIDAGGEPVVAPESTTIIPKASKLMSLDDVVKVVGPLVAGQKISAIKHFREVSGYGLKESKDAVDELAARLNLGGAVLWTPPRNTF
jgi:ribosomal protein L7/L12